MSKFWEGRCWLEEADKVLAKATVKEEVKESGEEFSVSDELISSFIAEGKNKRTCGQAAKVVWRTTIPPDALKVIVCRVNQESGTVLVHPFRNSFPRKEYCVPSCLVNIKKGRAMVPVLNISPATLVFKANDRLTAIDFAYDALAQLVEEKELLEEEDEEEQSKDEPKM